VREQVIGAIVSAMCNSYVIVMAAGSVAVVTSLLMKWEKLSMEISVGG
jgi:hypothetical protein